MKMLILLNSVLLIFSAVSIIAIFCLYPIITWIACLTKRKKTVKSSSIGPSISVLTIVHNAKDLVINKIENGLSLEYPSDRYEILIFSDGSDDGTEDELRHFQHSKVRNVLSPIHEGKNNAINKAVELCLGEIIVFSDVDAILDPYAVTSLIKYFSDPEIGGVCGRRVINEDNEIMKGPQTDYIRIDSRMKVLESRIGSISSNDGKLFAIRKSLFRPIPPGVTDDLYTCLAIVRQHYRFVFAPEAKALIKLPSRTPAHEVRRRRRIVCRSLRGIWSSREALNVFRYGFFSVRLLVNKVFRRLLPIYLLLALVSSFFLSFYYPELKIVFHAQAGFYGLGFSYSVFRHFSFCRWLKRITSLAYYFCIGNYGTFLGVLDFLRGKQVVKWKPYKRDAA